jgi:hypothetical protein
LQVKRFADPIAMQLQLTLGALALAVLPAQAAMCEPFNHTFVLL